jgi:hypothetical protein
MGYLLVGIAIIAILYLLSKSSETKEQAQAGEAGSTERTGSGQLGGPTDDVVSIIDNLDDPVSVRRIYRSVFAFGDQDALIRYYQRKHSCGEVDAMRYAIADRQNDEERYR